MARESNHMWRTVAAAAVLGIATTLPARASEPLFATSPITVVIPYTAGASADVTMRMLTQKITDTTGQRFLIRNMPGSGAVLAAQTVVRAAPDGQTLLQVVVGTQATSQKANKPQPYDLLADLEPISLLWSFPLFMVIPGTSKDASVADLVARAKATSGGLNYASPGINTAAHFLGEILSRQAGAPMLHIPYLGASPAMTDLIAGRVDFYFVSYASAISFVTSGRLKLLAVASPARVPLLKDVPTMTEAGYPDATMESQFGIAAPAKTPASVVARLNAMFKAAAKDPAVAAKADSQGLELTLNSPAEFRGMIAAELKRVDQLLAARNVSR